MDDKVIELVSSTDVSNAALLDFAHEVDELIKKHHHLHPHDILAILTTTCTAYQLTTLIEMYDE